MQKQKQNQTSIKRKNNLKKRKITQNWIRLLITVPIILDQAGVYCFRYFGSGCFHYCSGDFM
jgi:hypothetical protein